MNDYTEEDFKNARFAHHYAGATSRRALNGMWDSGPSGRRRTDAEMASDGWRPVHEDLASTGWRHVHEANAEHVQGLEEGLAKAREKDRHLWGRVRHQEHKIKQLHYENECQIEEKRVLRSQIIDLELEIENLNRTQNQPLTLDTLREAWESAIGSTAVHVGDTIIQRDTGGESFSVYVADRGHPRASVDIRVLRRAPQPEPWQALAEVMRQWDATPETGHSADSMARWFYERGVRVTGGDEK